MGNRRDNTDHNATSEGRRTNGRARPSVPNEGLEVHLACGTAHRLNEACSVPPDSPRGMLNRALDATMTHHDRALDRIAAIHQLRQFLDNEEKMAVIGARKARCTWAELGAAIGTSRQGAYNRWGEMVSRYEDVGLLDEVG